MIKLPTIALLMTVLYSSLFVVEASMMVVDKVMDLVKRCALVSSVCFVKVCAFL